MTTGASENDGAGAAPLTLVKLGGSLITDKTREAHARVDEIRRLASEMAAVSDEAGATAGRLLVGHGSGSFGHVAAREHGVGERGFDGRPPAAAAAVRQAASLLHQQVTGALLEAGVPAWSWPPSATLLADRGRPVRADVHPLLRALDRGLVPVTYGDAVLDRSWGASICSTEAVLRYLVGRLRRCGRPLDRLVWLGDTDGIYDRDGETVPRVDAQNYRRVRRMVGGSAGTDVTGGMLLRLQTARDLARLGIESWIVDGHRPGLLAAALRGEDLPGTRVVPF